MNQYETDEGPVNTVKGFNKVQFEDESTEILGFNRVESFLNNTNRLDDLMIFKEPKFLL